jgi:hypothetical protein
MRMIDEEIERTGRSTASRHIRSEVKAGHCRCDLENPSGRCCLGEVMQREMNPFWPRDGLSTMVQGVSCSAVKAERR